MFQDGWICSACWKSNRARDARCYACKTPRAQQVSTERGSVVAKVKPEAQLAGRMDAQVPLLAMLTAWPLRLTGIAAVGLGAIGAVLTLLSRGAGQPPVLGMDAKLFVLLIMMAIIATGALQIFLAQSVRRHARWAYAITIIIGLAVSLTRLLDLIPASPLLSGRSLAIYYGSAWIYLAMAVLAAVLLAMSFVGQEREPDSSRA